MPGLACDCHVHIFGPAGSYPYAAKRSYTPGEASVADLLALHDALGVERVVLVQPSPYGTDNTRLLAGLAELGARARGVAVIDPAIEPAELQRLHAAGVRGARVNLETEGEHDPAAALARLQAISARVAPLGWHVQTYTSLPVLAALHDAILALPTPLVVDHFARVPAAEGIEQPYLAELLSLLRSGRVYVKLSAPRRISKPPECAAAIDIARALIWANPDRVLWGTDWPHTSTKRHHGKPEAIEAFEPEDDGRALNRLNAWASEPALLHRILVRNPARLYRFGNSP
jgi:predicted TIM-barrel fold metal-dependent hydrolase